MNVVLLKHVEKLGMQGDVCTVSEGYARNFLFPRGLAAVATAEALRQADRIRKEREQVAVADLGVAEEIAKKLDGYELEIPAKANESGTLFAAVTAKTLVGALKKSGFDLQEKAVVLKEPIKETGEHEVRLELPHGLEANIRVIVRAA